MPHFSHLLKIDNLYEADLIKVDLDTHASDNPQTHNRWHPDIPMACWVKPGDDFILETYDWTSGAIANNDDPADVRDVDLSTVQEQLPLAHGIERLAL